MDASSPTQSATQPPPAATRPAAPPAADAGTAALEALLQSSQAWQSLAPEARAELMELLAPELARARRKAAGDPYATLMSQPLRSLLRHAPVTVSPGTSVAEAAARMRTHGVSSVLLVDASGRLRGIATDRDLRNRVLAVGADPALPVEAIATARLQVAQADAPAFEALLAMARHSIHHVPVLDGDKPIGLVTHTDLQQRLASSAVHLAATLHREQDVAGLARGVQAVPQLLRDLVAADASARATGQMVTAVTDAATIRLLQLAEAALGPPPVPYVWVAAGSQARQEQTARTDQDNALVMADGYDASAHGSYFRELARFVNDGLNACGYVYCPGEMMARTDAWRQPVSTWRSLFRRWTSTPEPKALMLTSVFFDLRAVHGDAALLEGLRREVLETTRGNRLFLAHLAANALKMRPPIGLFGQISTTREGDRRDLVDLKMGGLAPIVDLARLHALSLGDMAVNTHERLQTTGAGAEISEGAAHDLRDAFEFIGMARLRHQVRRLEAGEAPDNLVSLGELSHLERRQLKDALQVVNELHQVLAQRYR